MGMEIGQKFIGGHFDGSDGIVTKVEPQANGDEIVEVTFRTLVAKPYLAKGAGPQSAIGPAIQPPNL